MTAGELFLQECHYLPQIWSSNIKSKPVRNTDRQGTATAEVKAAFQIWRESVTPEKAWGWKNITEPSSSLTLTVTPISNNKNIITKNLKTSANVVWLITFVLQQVLSSSQIFLHHIEETLSAHLPSAHSLNIRATSLVTYALFFLLVQANTRTFAHNWAAVSPKSVLPSKSH